MTPLAINTIGLTGGEILCAELAKHPDVLMLPGQNFIQYKHSCYRPHCYEGMEGEEVFKMLSMHQYTKSGACWSGLTKSMSPAAKLEYAGERHRELFVDKLGSDRGFLRVIRTYVEAYSAITQSDVREARYFGWFGHNVILNQANYADFSSATRLIDWTNPPDYWLANISQRFVWDNLEALKFWLVNTLVTQYLSRQFAHFLSVDIRELVADRSAVAHRLFRFLELDAGRANSTPPDGFIVYRSDMVAKIEADSVEMRKIYGRQAIYRLAETLSSWGDEFLGDPYNQQLLKSYVKFWNTTAHTNLDWIGPVEQEIVERALVLTGLKSERNRSVWFFHECFKLSCDWYASPKGDLEHYLGCIEEEIVFPRLPYYARIVAYYLEKVADNTIRRPYSAIPLRRTHLYRRLMEVGADGNFGKWAMTDKVTGMEHKIDLANQAMSSYYPIKNED